MIIITTSMTMASCDLPPPRRQTAIKTTLMILNENNRSPVRKD
jgi:hypothetical protein